jgi:hypothetical protein
MEHNPIEQTMKQMLESLDTPEKALSALIKLGQRKDETILGFIDLNRQCQALAKKWRDEHKSCDCADELEAIISVKEPAKQ